MAKTGYERYGDDLFRSTIPGEQARLESLAAAFDPATRARLAAIGPEPGWRCLDVGAGPGTVSRWLAMQVGPNGSVTALDRDTRFLNPGADARIHLLPADITDAALQPGQFDLVHARFVLMHLRQRSSLLPRLVSWVRPGGYLVLSDSADLGTPSSPHPAFRQALTALWEFLAETIGTDINYGRRHSAEFAPLGLNDVCQHVDMPTVSFDSPLAKFWIHTLSQTLPRMVSGNVLTRETAQETLDYLASPALSDLSIAMITTIGRKPG